MAGPTSGARRRLFAFIFKRHGEKVTILRSSIAGFDEYGVPNDSWHEIGSEYVYRVYTEDRDPIILNLNTGPTRVESPAALCRWNTEIREGDRLQFHDRLYEVEALTTFATHREAELAEV
jgi:hypothetical protein